MKASIKTLFILLIISFFYFLFSIQDQDIHLLSLDQIGRREEISFKEGQVLIAGESVTIETTAIHSNLGIILVRFYNDNRDSNDRLSFAIVKKDTGELLHQSEHNTDQFLPNRLYGFGIPPQSGSADTKYLISLTSLRGSTESGIFISGKEPIFQLRSVLGKQEVLSNPSLALKIAINKINLLLSNKDTRLSLLISVIPVIFYLILTAFTGSGFGYLFFIFVFAIYSVSKLPSQHLDYYLLSLAFFWYQLLTKNHLSFFHGLCCSLLIFLFGTKDCYLALSLLMILTCLFVPNRFPNQSLKDFWQNINDFRISEKGWKLKFVLGVIILISVSFCIKIIFETIWPYFTVHQALASFPRNYPKEVFLIVLQLVFTWSFIMTIVYLWHKHLAPILFFASFILVMFVFQHVSIGFYSIFTNHLKSVHLVSISPSSVSEAWVDVTLTGKNFQDEPFRGQVLLGPEKVPQRVISWTDEKIIFRTNPELTKSGDICIASRSKGISNCLPFGYQFNQQPKIQ